MPAHELSSSSDAQKENYVLKESQQERKKKLLFAYSCFLNYLAFLRPAADWADSTFSWVQSRGRS
jgi:hypothetical protein